MLTIKKRTVRVTAYTLLFSLTYQLIYPLRALALTTGPSQPEVQSFEPVGTTEMVNMFSGDFNYNIPLMDVEGYPINIAYHSGISIEQEASWVGLGWNINSGEINRSVRGLPDDFNGETIDKELNIKTEHNLRIAGGANFGSELIGKDLRVGLSASAYINFNNYKGVGVGAIVNGSLSIFNTVDLGAGVGIGSQTGADIDLNAGVGYHSSTEAANEAKGSGGGSAGVSTGFNSRAGLKDLSFSVSGGMTTSGTKDHKGSISDINTAYNTSIPIGLQNFVPVVTNASTMNGMQFQIKGGGEAWSLFPNIYFSAGISDVTYDRNGARNGYGYMYLENAPTEGSAILDFSRDKESVYNKTIQNLAAGSLTYDIYSINGQGTGGMFRPFRNDIGTVYDPLTSSTANNNDVLAEFGVGNLFEVGSDFNFYDNVNTSGPWNKLGFSTDMPGSLYEKVYFKQAGEPTYNQQADATSLFNDEPVYLREDMKSLIGRGGVTGSLPNAVNGKRIYWDNNAIDRTTRANLLTFLTAKEASLPEIAQYTNYKGYVNRNTDNSRYFDPVEKSYSRYQENNFTKAQPDHISEFTQTLNDGRRYVYGIPAMNNISREVSFAVDEGSNVDINSGLVNYSPGDDLPSNQKGRDNFFSGTNTPAYAHSYLLTSVLSNDYVDIMGDGPTDDDLGTFVKFNYNRVDSDYRWRTPYNSSQAQYNPGFWSDYQDGRGNYLTGSREQWHIRSIESKNYVAEFYISPREDGKGTSAPVLPAANKITGSNLYTAPRQQGVSVGYKLDSIKLYNKHDRYLNEENAVPIKTVIFSYSYRLCPGSPNSTATVATLTNADGTTTTTLPQGKLTLERIYFRYGKSEKSLLSPYAFSYNTPNPSYDFASKDRWGNYKKNNPGLTNYEYPYTSQDSVSGQDSVTSWNMTDVKLPSGGNIHVSYESDDYAYVQDRRSMQMFQVVGLGKTNKFSQKTTLYDDGNSPNDYVYFLRRKNKEQPGKTLAENYLDGQTQLYYSFNMDITGKGRYEHIKGYANIADVGYCNNDPSSPYGYVRLKTESLEGMQLHPATVYGLNMARYYLPHILYPGTSGGDDASIIMGLIGSITELMHMRKPFVPFIKEGKGRNVHLEKSWVRLQTPGLTKRGGGVRVKQLELQDNWSKLSGNNPSGDARYGKQYDYTIQDPRYGTVSSGVASYEPMIGNDENPFRRPVPWQADAGRLLPAMEFYQEEPFGESFFPGAEVGYSSVRVRSIHVNEGRSSQSEDEYLYYTAKDFPISVKYTDKYDPGAQRSKSLRKETLEEQALQGYALTFNDMHGKPRAVNNYVLHTDASSGYVTKELITGIKYNYQTNATGSLDNTITAMVRNRGTVNTYDVRPVTIGKEMDFTVDSREKYFRSFNREISMNLNASIWGVVPPVLIPIPTSFFPDKEIVQTLKMQVSTKIIQQYGILKSMEAFDHGAKTITENLIFDAETGSVLLSRTNNEFNDNIYNLKHPAYLAYEGMGPAYTNAGYEEYADSLVTNSVQDGFLYTDNLDRFSPGDELEVNTGSAKYKLWVTGTGINVDDQTTPPGDGPPDPVDSSKPMGTVVFWVPVTSTNIGNAAFPINVTCNGASASITQGVNSAPDCYAAGCATFTIPAGTYTQGDKPSFFVAKNSAGNTTTWKNNNIPSFTLGAGQCVAIRLLPPNTPPTSGANMRTLNGARCAVMVQPRFKLILDPTQSFSASNWPLPGIKTKRSNVYVKIIRSGRRNNLSANAQEIAMTKNPYKGHVADLFGPYTGSTGAAFDSLLAISATTYTDSATPFTWYENFVDFYSKSGSGNLDTGYTYTDMNKYVTGTRGNFRPESQFVRFANRSYTAGHTRYDGTFPLSQTFWSFVNSYSVGDCSAPHNVLLPLKAIAVPQYWKLVKTTTKYDVFGNAVEETDALGNYSAAQYGYNRQLPLSVIKNASQGSFFFEGFEDYLMLMPEFIRRAFANQDYHASPFPRLFTTYKNTLSTDEPSMMSRYGQRYSVRNAAGNTNNSYLITNEASHTGYYSIKCTSPLAVSIPVGSIRPDIIPGFTMTSNKKYIVDLWVKPVSGSINSVASQFNLTYFGTTYPMSVKTGNIDGWYLLEGVVQLNPSSFSGAALNIPANVYVDDARIFPADANMKSFVYDPLTFKLAAELDENHFATFYEYDQEGLLVRVKKETDQGILSVSESRRSSMKK